MPPVQAWHPERTGAIDIVIEADGRWLHEGREIVRAGMVRVFASILRHDSDGFFLVTPAERLAVTVVDAPFVGIDCDVRGAAEDTDLLVTTNVDDHVLVGPEHALTMRDGRPYVHVRHGLLAMLNRNAYYRLVEAGHLDGDEVCVYSQGVKFPLGQAA